MSAARPAGCAAAADAARARSRGHEMPRRRSRRALAERERSRRRVEMDCRRLRQRGICRRRSRRAEAQRSRRMGVVGDPWRRFGGGCGAGGSRILAPGAGCRRHAQICRDTAGWMGSRAGAGVGSLHGSAGDLARWTTTRDCGDRAGQENADLDPPARRIGCGAITGDRRRDSAVLVARQPLSCILRRRSTEKNGGGRRPGRHDLRRSNSYGWHVGHERSDRVRAGQFISASKSVGGGRRAGAGHSIYRRRDTAVASKLSSGRPAFHLPV